MVTLGRKRLLRTTRTNPEYLDGRILYVPKLQDIKKVVEEQGGWELGLSETQTEQSFKFNGRFFRKFMESVLGKQVDRVYFPAAYTGKVALSLKEAGLDVLASDISHVIVDHLLSQGLRAQKRSIEEIPREPFDAVVSFEPYCIDHSILGYLTVLEMLSRDLPYIKIADSLYNIVPYGDTETIRRKKIHHDENKIPNSSGSMERLAYDYGAQHRNYVIYCAQRFFRVTSIVPTKNAGKRAAQDLQLINDLQECLEQGSLSIAKYASRHGMDEGRAAAAMHRLDHVLDKRFDLRYVYFLEAHVPFDVFGFMEPPEKLLKEFISWIQVGK